VGHAGFAIGGRKGQALVHAVPASPSSHGGGGPVLPTFSRFTDRGPRRNPAPREQNMGLIQDRNGHYRRRGPITEQDILNAAETLLRAKLERQGSISNPQDARDFLRMRLGALLHEEFHILWLDHRHRILDCQRLFTGTVDGASVYPREVVRAALTLNASAAILAHNHPSGVADPSQADRSITQELIAALQLVGVRVLDHLVVTAGEATSMAARGLL